MAGFGVWGMGGIGGRGVCVSGGSGLVGGFRVDLPELFGEGFDGLSEVGCGFFGV